MLWENLREEEFEAAIWLEFCNHRINTPFAWMANYPNLYERDARGHERKNGI